MLFNRPFSLEKASSAFNLFSVKSVKFWICDKYQETNNILIILGDTIKISLGNSNRCFENQLFGKNVK